MLNSGGKKLYVKVRSFFVLFSYGFYRCQFTGLTM